MSIYVCVDKCVLNDGITVILGVLLTPQWIMNKQLVSEKLRIFASELGMCLSGRESTSLHMWDSVFDLQSWKKFLLQFLYWISAKTSCIDLFLQYTIFTPQWQKAFHLLVCRPMINSNPLSIQLTGDQSYVHLPRPPVDFLHWYPRT